MAFTLRGSKLAASSLSRCGNPCCGAFDLHPPISRLRLHMNNLRGIPASRSIARCILPIKVGALRVMRAAGLDQIAEVGVVLDLTAERIPCSDYFGNRVSVPYEVAIPVIST